IPIYFFVYNLIPLKSYLLQSNYGLNLRKREYLRAKRFSIEGVYFNSDGNIVLLFEKIANKCGDVTNDNVHSGQL
ncbi:hypothetical protein RQP52_30490, partial [Paenibacillus sp. PFR10]